MLPPPSRGALVAGFAAVYLLWGSTYLAIRFAVESFPPFLMAGTRHLTAGLLLFAWLRVRGVPLPRRAHWKSAFIIGGLLLLGGNGFVSWAEQRVPSGLAALIVASVPIWMAVAQGIQRRKRPPAAVLGGLFLGLCGLVLLVLPGKFGGGEHVDPLGAAALLFAALSWVIGSLYSRKAKPRSRRCSRSPWKWSPGACCCGSSDSRSARPAGSPPPLSRRSPFLSRLPDRLRIADRVLGVHLAAQGDDAGALTTYAYVNPVVAVLLGALFAGEELTLRIGLAAAAIVGAVAVIIRYGGEAKPESRAEVSTAGRNLRERAS